MEEVSFKLEAFEGPLDLLLHLIEKNKVNIYDIPIVLITDQYMDYLKHMQEDRQTRPNLDIMSDFLVMAATLLNIKAHMLLPKEEPEEQEDPRADLVERLLEHKMFLYLSGELKTQEEAAGRSIFREAHIPLEIADYKEVIDPEEVIMNSNVDADRLWEVFREVIRRQKDKIDPVRSGFGRIEPEAVNVREKMHYVVDYCRSHHRTDFKRLLQKQESRSEVVVTLLCLLEMMKTGMVNIVQDDLFSDITIEYQGKGETDGLEEIGSYG